MTWTAVNSEGYATPAALAADTVAVTVRNDLLCVLAIDAPDGRRALPGGFVGASESPLTTARRKLDEKAGVTDVYVEQLGAFAEPNRDTRGWIPSIAHLALVPVSTESDDGSWIAARGGELWAFDHGRIVAAAIDRIEGKLWWSNVAVGILPGAFSLTGARTVYEAIANTRYDPATFARDLKATGLIEPTGEVRSDGPGRPAALYRFTSHVAVWGSGRRKRVPAR